MSTGIESAFGGGIEMLEKMLDEFDDLFNI